MSLIPIVAAAAACAALASCTATAGPGGSETAGSEMADEFPEQEWHFSGVIAAVEPGETTTRVTVQLSRPVGSGDQAILLVSRQTQVTVRRADGTTRPGDVRDLAQGARFDARHTGVELRSLPPQYHATHVRVSAGP